MSRLLGRIGGGGGEGVLAGPSLTCLDEVLESLTHVQGDVTVTGEDRGLRGEGER